ncbi:hypothetical protein MNBD_DELTA02-243 [hydrothermal vent metagenome]|uniref:Uncharacterized protein n=1 Tax=hydrothermal vent metagenome TaxID=652676 RepID=A0A3B0VDY0_9ZZZZ
MSAALDREQVIIVLKNVSNGSDRLLNALRFCQMQVGEGEDVLIVLDGDSVFLGHKGRRLQRGAVSVEGIFVDIISKGARVVMHQESIKARGLTSDELLDGVEMTGVLAIKEWIEQGRQVLMF